MTTVSSCQQSAYDTQVKLIERYSVCFPRNGWFVARVVSVPRSKLLKVPRSRSVSLHVLSNESYQESFVECHRCCFDF